MNVVDVVLARALRRVLDEHGRTLYPEVSALARRRWAGPRKVRVGDARLNLLHFCGSGFVSEDADPLARELDEHGALRRREGRCANTFGLNHLAVGPGTEHEVANFKTKNRLF